MFGTYLQTNDGTSIPRVIETLLLSALLFCDSSNFNCDCLFMFHPDLL